jgi:hypothetical protein
MSQISRMSDEQMKKAVAFLERENVGRRPESRELVGALKRALAARQARREA